MASNFDNISASIIRDDQWFKVEGGVLQIAAKTSWQKHFPSFYKTASPLLSIKQALEQAIKADEHTKVLPERQKNLYANIAKINELIKVHNEGYWVYFFGGSIKSLSETKITANLIGTDKTAALAGRTLTPTTAESIERLQEEWKLLSSHHHGEKRAILSKVINDLSISNDQLFNFFSKIGINSESGFSSELMGQFFKCRRVSLYAFFENQIKLPLEPFIKNWHAIKNQEGDVSKFLIELIGNENLKDDQIYAFFVENGIKYSKLGLMHEKKRLDGVPDNIRGKDLYTFFREQEVAFINKKQNQWNAQQNELMSPFYSPLIKVEILEALIANKNLSNVDLLNFFKDNGISHSSDYLNPALLGKLEERGIINF